MIFTKNSAVVKAWVNLIRSGKKTMDDVPDISNLRAVVAEVLHN